MKKIMLFIIVIIAVMAVGATVYAGILSTAKEWVFENALGTILAGIFLIIGGFFGGSTWGKFLIKSKIPIYELKDIAVKVHNARRASSPGGKTITTEEKDEILKEVEELITSIVAVFGKAKTTA